MKEKRTRVALFDVRGLLTKIIDCLSGENHEYWIYVLNKVLRKEHPFPFWKTWKTITTKPLMGLSGNDIELQLSNNTPKVYSGADVGTAFFNAEFTLTEEEETDLVLIKLKDLGIKGLRSYRDICEYAVWAGLDLLRPEDVVALREQYIDQPEERSGQNTELYMAMKPLQSDNKGELYSFFGLCHQISQGGMYYYLRIRCIYPHNFNSKEEKYLENIQFVFRRRKLIDF